ncbi:glutamate 5-kinase [Desulfovibrio sp. OttesenSCG-928-G15]|nr:glutamate 5-kinase [Desulfovibrio sp. OttesenSCG-928-G15]
MSEAKNTHPRTIVIKLGTSVLTQGTRSLNRAHMVEIVRQCVLARNQGHSIILVSSGAIAAGREHLGYPSLPPAVASKQLLAAVGQSRLIQVWEQLFSIYGVNIGQMLLTRADLEDRERFLNARDMLRALLEYSIVPVINENDAVATATVKVGDNDNLSALAAILAGATTLVLLTDQQGLYTADPASDPTATLIPCVENIDDSIRALAGGAVSGLGTGGMWTKIQAAEMATNAGVEVIIASGAEPSVISRIAAGKAAGTRFLASHTPLESRKRWIYGAPPAGSLHVDKGAVTALLKGKSSLLPAGIQRINGVFSRGEVVHIVSPDGTDLAHGVARYGSDALELIKGRQSAEIASLLGYEYGPVAVHRDDLIMLEQDFDV